MAKFPFRRVPLDSSALLFRTNRALQVGPYNKSGRADDGSYVQETVNGVPVWNVPGTIFIFDKQEPLVLKVISDEAPDLSGDTDYDFTGKAVGYYYSPVNRPTDFMLSIRTDGPLVPHVLTPEREEPQVETPDVVEVPDEVDDDIVEVAHE